MHALAPLLPAGVGRRDDLALATSSTSVSRWLDSGALVLVHPGVVALPDRVDDWQVRAGAATLWTRAPLSHLSALTAAGLLPAPPPGPVHVTVPADRWPRGAAGVVAHRTTRPIGPTEGRETPRLPVARSLVDAWSWAHVPRTNPRAGTERPLVRQLVIDVVRRRDVSVPQVRRQSDGQPLRAGRAALGALLDLVEAGCQSELEIFGVTHVLLIPGIPAPVQQHRVFLPGGRYVDLDAAYVQARVGVELDGHRYHSSREDRERDMRKDTALATLGWISLRYSYRRLTGEPSACRREIEAVVRGRLDR